MITSEKIIERLSLYRRILMRLRDDGETVVFSHQLAVPAGITPAQVRRDIMNLGCNDTPRSGYRIKELLTGITEVFDTPQSQRAILVGIGRLGLALLAHFSGRWRWLHIHAAFDSDPAKSSGVISGCHCYPVDQLAVVVREWNIGIGIITVPANAAQSVADQMCAAGVTGLLNFTSVRLNVPRSVFVENVDLTASFEKVAYFARRHEAAGVTG